MRSTDRGDEKPPILGPPINRPKLDDLIPIPGRPRWFRHRVTGAEVYVEPPKKPAWPFPMQR